MNRGDGGASGAAKRWLFRTVALVLLPLVALFSLEAGLRVIGYGHPTSFWISADQPGRMKTNPRFGWRFFAPTMNQFPTPIVVDEKRPAEQLRIVVFGGSATNGWPTPAYSFSRILELMLAEAIPGARVEVLNAGVTAINSHVVLPIVRDSAVLDADLYIVYLGHNEVVGPFGAGSVIRGYQPSLGLIRASLAVRSTRLGQLLSALAATATRGDAAPPVWRGMEMFVDQEVAADDPRLEVIEAHLRANLGSIVEAAHEAQTPILLTLPLVNLRSLPPFASTDAAEVPRPQRLEARELAFRARRLASEGRPGDALPLFETAGELDPGHAMTRYELGRALLLSGETERARHHLEAARDLDALRFRADARMLTAIAEVARETKTPVVDVAAETDVMHPSGIVGEELLLEHVHLTFEGNYAVAAALFGGVVEQLESSGRLPHAERTRQPPTLAICAERLGLSRSWVQRAGLEALQAIASRPPFTSEWRDEAVTRWQARALGRTQEPPSDDETLKTLLDALSGRPEDVLLHEVVASELARAGRANEAIDQLETIVTQYPDWEWIRTRLARFHLLAGELEPAEAHARAALAVNPGAFAAWSVLAEVLGGQDRLEAAIEAASSAARLVPDAAEYHFQRGRLLVRAERIEAAKTALQQAVALVPDHAPSLHQLARIEADRGQPAAALDLALRAARAAPSSIDILVDVTRFALDAGREGLANRTWSSARALDPEVGSRHSRIAARLDAEVKGSAASTP